MRGGKDLQIEHAGRFGALDLVPAALLEEGVELKEAGLVGCACAGVGGGGGRRTSRSSSLVGMDFSLRLSSTAFLKAGVSGILVVECLLYWG